MLVTGKGGAGKSTVAALLAEILRRRGKRVLLAGGVDGAAALGEYLGLVLPARLARRVTASSVYRQFVAAAPGLRELMVLGKLAHEARRDTAWDAVVADLPATGHALQMLRMPAVAAATFGGLVRREAERVFAQLRGPGTVVVPVALAEELAVSETLELCAALAELRLPAGPVVVNRVRHAPCAPDELRAPAGSPPLVVAALRAGREEAAWAEIHRRHLARLRAATRLPIIELPELPVDELGSAELARLAAELERGLSGEAARGAA